MNAKARAAVEPERGLGLRFRFGDVLLVGFKGGVVDLWVFGHISPDSGSVGKLYILAHRVFDELGAVQAGESSRTEAQRGLFHRK